MENNSLNLYELITAIKEELEQLDTDRRNSGKQALLQLEEVTLELNFVVTNQKKGDGKINIWVVTIGGEGSLEQQQTQKICLKLKLADVNRDDEDYPVGSRLHSTSKQNPKLKPFE